MEAFFEDFEKKLSTVEEKLDILSESPRSNRDC